MVLRGGTLSVLEENKREHEREREKKKRRRKRERESEKKRRRKIIARSHDYRGKIMAMIEHKKRA